MTVTGKRLLSMLVAVVMLLGMLPAGLADTATHEHIYDWRYPKGKAKNCLESKPVEIYCTICGKVVDSYDDLGPHEQGKWYWDGDKPENCLEYGIQNAKCKLCGEVSFEREIAGSHKWGEEKRVKAATCMNRGVKERTCSVCGLKETWETDYGSHDWGDWFVYEEATCIQKGSEVRYCRYCNEDVLRRNDFGPHAFGEWYVVKEAEIGVAGLEERKCSVCEMTEQREIPALVDISSYWPDITIKLDNTPANGTHFVPGEAAAFTVTCSNPNPIPATGVQMGYRVDSSNENNQDHMLAGASVPGAETLEPNTEATFSFTYTVTDADAECGAVYAAGFMDSEPYALYWSSYVTVPCGLDGGSMLEVTVAVENTPANGTHFVLGEKVFFHYYATNVSGGALYSVKASFMDDMGPRASVTSEKMEPGATIDGVYEITVTDVDVSNGAYYAFAMASGLTEKDQEAWGESDAVSVPCGEGRLPYLTEIDLELVSVEPVASIDPDDMTAGLLPGDPVKGVMRVTNVGETTVTLNAWYASDINGNSSGVMYDWNEKTETPPSSWFKAGETLETEFELIVTQTDIDNGAIYRSLTQYALPYYCIVNGEESDVPADIEPMPDGVAGWYGRDEEECSDTIEIIIPLTVKGEVEKPYHSGIDLELVSVEPVKSVNPDDMTAGLLPGDPVKGVMRVTNVGETTVTMNSWDASDINGNFIGVMFDWNEKTATPLSSWFMAGETLETEFELIVTQTDIDNGQIYRKFTQYARPLYCVVDGEVTDVPADIAPEPEGTTGWSSKTGEVCFDTIEIIIPLNAEGENGEAGETAYHTAIDLELVSVEPVKNVNPDDMTAGLLPGDPVKGVMRVTNTGETTVTMNSWIATDVNGNSIGVMFDWNEKTETPLSSWFMAGNMLETEFELIVTQTDIDNGQIYRKFTQYARPLYCVVDGVVTDVPADIAPDPEGTTGWSGKEEERCFDTIEIIIPLNAEGENGEAGEAAYHTAIDLELVSVEPVKNVNPDDMTAGLLPGDPVKGVMRVTNTGETTVTMNSWIATDVNGNFIGVMFDWNEKTETPLAYWFKAGNMLETEFELIVTQTDIDNGQIYRKFTQYARPLYCVVDGVVTDVPADIASEPEGTTDWSGKEEERCSDTIEIIIPLMNAGDAVPELECTITLHNQPENGEYFVPGERALFIVHYENPAPFDLVNAKIDAYTCANAVHNEGIKLDKRTVLLRESVAAGEVGDVGYDYTFTEEDAARGVVYTAAMFFDESNNYGRPLYECYTNFIPVPCGAGELSDDYEKPIAMLEKYVKNEPANGEAFVEGETIEYAVIFMNCVAHDLYDVEISDPLKGNNEDAILAREPVVESEGTLYLSFDYVVTAEDVERGYVENVAAAMWMNPEINEQGQCESNKVIALTADEDKVFGVLLTKSVASLPANGSFYTPGETVVFDVEATNYTGKDLQDLEVCDALFEEKFTDDEFLEGETHDLVYRYVVTELDAQAGSVSNYAWMRALGEDGYYLETSNVVTVDCGFADAPFGVIDSLSLVMQEESSPANGKYYTEGEVIHYSITYTNDGEVKLTEVMIYDAKTGLHEIAAAEMFAPGEVRTCYCQHTVTAEDVQRGYVENYGTAVYPMPGGTGLLSVYSNSVYSDTDGEADEKPAAPDAPGSTDPFESVIIPALPADPADPAAPDASDASAGKDFGKVNWEKLSGEAHCVHEIMVRTANSASYGNSFCAAHTATADAAAQQDGEHAAELWKADVLAMYEKLLEATDETARMNLTNEYLIFSSMMSNRELLFKTVYADQPQEAARLTALAWRDKCIGMCYEMSTAPEARADSLLYVEQAENVPGMEKKCAALTENETAQGFASADIICREHSVLFGMTDQLIGKENTAQGWQRVYQLWNCELNKAYNRLGSQLGEEKNVVLALERSMTEAWLGSRAAQLMALYPENPEICAEIITRAVMAQVQLLCGLIR